MYTLENPPAPKPRKNAKKKKAEQEEVAGEEGVEAAAAAPKPKRVRKKAAPKAAAPAAAAAAAAAAAPPGPSTAELVRQFNELDTAAKMAVLSRQFDGVLPVMPGLAQLPGGVPAEGMGMGGLPLPLPLPLPAAPMAAAAAAPAQAPVFEQPAEEVEALEVEAQAFVDLAAAEGEEEPAAAAKVRVCARHGACCSCILWRLLCRMWVLPAGRHCAGGGGLSAQLALPLPAFHPCLSVSAARQEGQTCSQEEEGGTACQEGDCCWRAGGRGGGLGVGDADPRHAAPRRQCGGLSWHRGQALARTQVCTAAGYGGRVCEPSHPCMLRL
jgi:hypothetical protein